MIYEQLFDVVDIGIVVLEGDLTIKSWNRWMEHHSGFRASDLIGNNLFHIYPHLNNPGFLRSVKYVKNFGNFYVFSQKLHQYLFPFQPISTFESEFKNMQQNCTMGILRDPAGGESFLYITIQDVTEIVIYDRKLLEMNIKDSLTGIYNRRFFETRLQEEFERYKRYRKTFSLILYDIDYFKKVNDTYGHQCGDFILKEVSARIAATIRPSDILARYGGEEFACILPEVDLAQAVTVAERFRNIIEREPFLCEGRPVEITVSLGAASLNDDMTSPDELLKNSDSALYHAKKSGRNCVVAHQENR